MAQDLKQNNVLELLKNLILPQLTQINNQPCHNENMPHTVHIGTDTNAGCYADREAPPFLISGDIGKNIHYQITLRGQQPIIDYLMNNRLWGVEFLMSLLAPNKLLKD